MANSNDNDAALTWSGATSKALDTTNRIDSDTVTIHADAVQAALQITATNPGTPAVADQVDFWIRWSVNGTTFDTDEHAQYLGRLDTYPSVDPGENPATRTFTLHVSGRQAFKLTAKSNQSTRQIALTAAYNEHRMV